MVIYQHSLKCSDSEIGKKIEEIIEVHGRHISGSIKISFISFCKDCGNSQWEINFFSYK